MSKLPWVLDVKRTVLENTQYCFLSWLCYTEFFMLLAYVWLSPGTRFRKIFGPWRLLLFWEHPHEQTLEIRTPTRANDWMRWRHKIFCLFLCYCCLLHRQTLHNIKIYVWQLRYLVLPYIYLSVCVASRWEKTKGFFFILDDRLTLHA